MDDPSHLPNVQRMGFKARTGQRGNLDTVFLWLSLETKNGRLA